MGDQGAIGIFYIDDPVAVDFDPGIQAVLGEKRTPELLARRPSPGGFRGALRLRLRRLTQAAPSASAAAASIGTQRKIRESSPLGHTPSYSLL